MWGPLEEGGEWQVGGEVEARGSTRGLAQVGAEGGGQVVVRVGLKSSRPRAGVELNNSGLVLDGGVKDTARLNWLFGVDGTVVLLLSWACCCWRSILGETTLILDPSLLFQCSGSMPSFFKREHKACAKGRILQQHVLIIKRCGKK